MDKPLNKKRIPTGASPDYANDLGGTMTYRSEQPDMEEIKAYLDELCATLEEEEDTQVEWLKPLALSA